MSKIHFHRRNLPHLYKDEGIYFITFRLAESIPSDKVVEIKKVIDNGKEMNDEKFKRLLEKYDAILDSGTYGKKYLADAKIAEICKYSLQFPDRKDYNLICYCIMPNHIHLIIILDPSKINVVTSRDLSLNK